MGHEKREQAAQLPPAADGNQGRAALAPGDASPLPGAQLRALEMRSRYYPLTPADPLLVYYEAAWVALSDLEDAVKARLFLTVDGRSGCYLGATAELVQTIRQAVEVIKGDVERGGVPVTGSPERPWEVSTRRVLAEQEG